MPNNSRHNQNHTKKSQVHRPAFFVLKIVWAIVVLVWISFTLHTSFNSYQNISMAIAQAMGKPSHIDVLRSQYFPPSLLPVLRVLCWLVLAGLMLAYRYLSKFTCILLAFAAIGLQLTLLAFRGISTCSRSQKLVLIAYSLTFFVSRVYYAWLFPLQYDEAFSYIHLIHKGLFTSAVYYPGPNNHIFFSNIASVLNLILPPLAALRLPVIIGTTLGWYFLWDWLYTKIRFEWALLLASIVFFLPLMGIYGIIGRGYSLQFLFMLIACRAILASTFQAHHRRAFLISSVLGFYLIPTFLYLFVTLVVYKTGQIILAKEKKDLFKQWAKDLGIISLITTLLYSPVIAANGLNALVNNGWVASLSFEQWRTQFPAYFSELGNALWGESRGQWVWMAYLTGVGLAFILSPKKHVFILISLLIPLLMITLQRVLPPYRIWLYWLLPFGWFVALILQKIKGFKLIISIMLTFVLLFYVITTTGLFYKGADMPHIRIAEKISQVSSPQKVFVNHDTYAVFLQYMSLDKKHRVDIKQDKKVKYDWLVLKKPVGKEYKHLAKGYKVFFEDGEVKVYRLK